MKASAYWLSFLLLLVVSMAWGSSYILMKKGLMYLDPYQMASIRLFIAGLCFTPFVFSRFEKRHIPLLPYFLIVGFCGSGIPSFCFAIAQTKIVSGLSGALSSLTPIFTLILGMLFYRLAYSGWRILGIVIGLSGALMIILARSDLGGIADPWYGLFIVVASILYAWSTNTIGHRLSSENSFTVSVIAFSLMMPAATVLFFATSAYDVVAASDSILSDFWPVILLAILGSVITSIVYFYLIRISGSLFASTVSYLTPAVAIILGLLDGEQIHIIQVAGLLLMCGGIMLSRRQTVNYTGNK